jgi:hypothetical protein
VVSRAPRRTARGSPARMDGLISITNYRPIHSGMMLGHPSFRRAALPAVAAVAAFSAAYLLARAVDSPGKSG